MSYGQNTAASQVTESGQAALRGELTRAIERIAAIEDRMHQHAILLYGTRPEKLADGGAPTGGLPESIIQSFRSLHQLIGRVESRMIEIENGY